MIVIANKNAIIDVGQPYFPKADALPGCATPRTAEMLGSRGF